MSRGYFDLQPPPELGNFSMARHLRRPRLRGRHRRPAGGGGERRAGRRLHAHARRRRRRQRVRRSTRCSRAGPTRSAIGVGHSAGALLTVVQQARHRTYDALGLLGFGGGGHEHFALHPRRSASQARRDRRAHARTLRRPAARGGRRRRRRSCSVGWRCPPDVLDALGSVKSALLAVVGLTSMIPGSVAREMAAVDVPVFLGARRPRHRRRSARASRRASPGATTSRCSCSRHRPQPQRGARPGGALGPLRRLGRAGPAGFVVSASRSVATGGMRCRRSPSRS